MKHPETFSIVLISKNEEEKLPHLLDSLVEFRDKYKGEVILCDTGSTDNTAKIAKEWGVKVFEEGTKFCAKFDKKQLKDLQDKYNKIIEDSGEIKLSIVPDKFYFQYDEARNYADSKASNDWIFSPDCDEVVDWNLEEVHKLLPLHDQLRYNFVFAWDEHGNPAIQFQHSKFFRRSKLKWYNHIHEILQPVRGVEPKWAEFTDHIFLKHYQNEKQNRGHYLPMLEYDVISNPTNDRNVYYLAREYMYNSRYDDAIILFTHYLSMPNGWHPEQGQAKIFIGDCYKFKGDTKSAEQWYHRAMRHDPTRREPFFACAELYHELRDWQQSSIYMGAALQVPYHGGFYGTRMDLYKERIHVLQSVNKYYLGRKEEAKEELNKAYKENPQDELTLKNFQYLIDFPPVTIVIPTLNRNTDKLVESLENDNYFGSKQILIKKDKDAEGCPVTLNKGVSEAEHDFVVFLGDDCTVEKNWLNHAMITYQNSFSDGIGVVALNDGVFHSDWEPKLALHWLSNRKMLPYLKGNVFFTEMVRHYGCDDYLTLQAQILNKLAFAEHSIIKHDKKEDDTNKKACATLDKDRPLIREELNKLRKEFNLPEINYS